MRNPDNQHQLALASAIHAEAQLDARDKATRRDALGLLNRAVDGFSALARDFPKISHYRLYQAEAMADRASVLIDILREHAPADAAQLREKAGSDAARSIRLLEDLVRERPRSPAYLGPLGRAVGEQGRFLGNRKLLRRAVELEEQALKANPDNPRDGEALKRFRAELDAIHP